jgi:hypothetical protein
LSVSRATAPSLGATDPVAIAAELFSPAGADGPATSPLHPATFSIPACAADADASPDWRMVALWFAVMSQLMRAPRSDWVIPCSIAASFVIWAAVRTAFV